MASTLNKLSFLILALTPLGYSTATCPPCKCQGGEYAQIANALKGFPPASTFCSSKFPVPVQTCTTTGVPSTITTTVATSTVTTTVATNTITATASPVTITSSVTTTPTITSTQTDTETDTETDTLTTTTTTTVTAGPNQKRAAPTDTRSSKWSSIKSKASSYVGAVCTCLETPASTTVTATPKVTKSVTATSTKSVTASSTITTTPSTTITNTITAAPQTTVVTTTSTTTTTTTTTTTVTATATVACSPDLNTDRRNCGACGRSCVDGQACYSGKCTDLPSCSPVYDLCNDVNSGNCACYQGSSGRGVCYTNGGTCGQQCQTGFDCANGQQCITDCPGGTCTEAGQAAACQNAGSAKFLFKRERRGEARLPWVEPKDG